MHVVFSCARAEHNIVANSAQLLEYFKVCTHHVPEELISFLIQNAKSDALISLQPTKFPLGKIVKVFLGDHSITN